MLWVRKEIKFGYSCFLGKILHSWYRQSSFLHSATPRARDGLSVSRVQDFAEKALVPKLDSYSSALLRDKYPECEDNLLHGRSYEATAKTSSAELSLIKYSQVVVFKLSLFQFIEGQPLGLMKQSEPCHKLYPTSIPMYCMSSKQEVASVRFIPCPELQRIPDIGKNQIFLLLTTCARWICFCMWGENLTKQC